MNARLSVQEVAAPVWRLVWSRRLVLPAIGLTALAGFVGWIGAMIQFSRVTPAPGDPMFAPLVAASALVMLPSVVGLLAGDAIQQLARRPSLRLLPALHGRLLAALGALALVTCALVAACAVQFRAELSMVTALGPAALGFALGVLFPGRARKGLAWIAALAFPVLADPLCHVAAHPLVTIALIAGCAAAVQLELRRLLRPGVNLEPGVTWLQPLGSQSARRSAKRSVVHGRAQVAPPERVAGRRGWLAAHLFEHRSTQNSILAPAGTAQFVAVCFAVSMVTPVSQGLGAGGPGFKDLIATVAEAVVGPIEASTRLGWSASSTVVLVTWAASAIVAAFAGAPLLGQWLYPISRRDRADLCVAITRRASLLVCVVQLALGGVASVALLATLDIAWQRALPTFAWVALVGLATAPWVQVLWLALTRQLRKQQGWRTWGLGFAGLALPVVLVCVTWDLWAHKSGRPVTAPWIAAYAVVLAAGWSAHAPLLRRHFARCDLQG
ncbi:MAG: hypothetical protein R3F49_24730 [Planctomycetota bacterium]